MSTTKIRSGTPTCGAASPTPGAAYIVSIMSSMSAIDLRRDGSTGSARLVEGGVAVSENRPNHRLSRTDRAQKAATRSRSQVADESARCPLAERLPVRDQLLDRVAAELFDRPRRRARSRPSPRRRRRRRERRRRRCVRSPPGSRSCREIDRAQRLHQRRDRLHVAGDAQILAVGDAAFEAAGVVGRPRDAGDRRRRRSRAAGSRRGPASRARRRPPGRGRCRPP